MINLYPAQFDDFFVYGDENSNGWSSRHIDRIQSSAAAGIHKWLGEDPSISHWAETFTAVETALSNVLAAQAYYGGAARTAELKSQIQQRMVDAVDTATARLVNKDIDRLGALRAAGEVREQLAQAMMQTQTNTLSAQTSLFSNALGVFDAINLGGFKPQGLSFG